MTYQIICRRIDFEIAAENRYIYYETDSKELADAIVFGLNREIRQPFIYDVVAINN